MCLHSQCWASRRDRLQHTSAGPHSFPLCINKKVNIALFSSHDGTSSQYTHLWTAWALVVTGLVALKGDSVWGLWAMQINTLEGKRKCHQVSRDALRLERDLRIKMKTHSFNPYLFSHILKTAPLKPVLLTYLVAMQTKISFSCVQVCSVYR